MTPRFPSSVRVDDVSQSLASLRAAALHRCSMAALVRDCAIVSTWQDCSGFAIGGTWYQGELLNAVDAELARRTGVPHRRRARLRVVPS